MHCPTLNELPSSPRGKAGWPWTEGSAAVADMMPDGSPWPRISIVTPSYNQGQFLEETIRLLVARYLFVPSVGCGCSLADNRCKVIFSAD